MALISAQGIRPGSINMGRILRNLRHHSDMSRKVVYHRPPIFTKDDYGVETDTTSTAELLLPDLPALIRPALTADYVMERAGVNIVGAARVYTPNMQTIKGYPNFDQDNNTDFNEIEGWDRFIDVIRDIFHLPTDNEEDWTSTNAVTSDGEKIIVTRSDANDAVTWSGNTGSSPVRGPKNTLEADRIKFQIMASGAANNYLESFVSTNASATLTYSLPAVNSLLIPTGSWLTVDVPYVTGTIASGTSIYSGGARNAITVASGGAAFDYEDTLSTFAVNLNDGSDGGAAEDTIVYIKNLKYYKSISWHVHSLKEINTQFTIYNCVRVRGRRDSIRRSYDT